MSALIEANGQTLNGEVERGALRNIYLSRIEPRHATKMDSMTIDVAKQVKIVPPQSIDGIVDFAKPDPKF
jgi:hypothetical protein